MAPCSSLVLALLVTTTTAEVASGHSAGTVYARPPPAFLVDLDAAPEARWRGAVGAVVAAHGWEHSFGASFAAHNATLFDALLPEHYAALGAAVTAHFPEQAAELRGLVAEFARYAPAAAAGAAAGAELVSFEYLCAWVWFHELDHTDLASSSASTAAAAAASTSDAASSDAASHRECTAIVAQDASGAIVHGRNMDQSPPSVRNCTLRLTFARGGAPLFEAVDWYWFTTGVMTAVRRSVASLQENWRFTPTQPHAQVLAAAANGTLPQVFFFRQLLSRDYDSAAPAPAPAPAGGVVSAFGAVLGAIEATAFATGMYVVAAGSAPGEGAVVTKGSGPGVALPTLLLADVMAARNASAPAADPAADYFLTQTNYDQPGPDPAGDARRTAAQRAMRALGQAEGASALGVFAAISTAPVLNDDTAYTAVMRAATGELHAFVR